MIDRRIEVYDIEVLTNCHTYTGINIDTGVCMQFVIHSNRNNLIEYIDHLKSLKKCIGFNNIEYDYPIIHFILTNYNSWLNLDGEQIANIIYEFSQKVIESENKFEYIIPFFRWKIDQLDLYKLLHYDNKAKRCGLKWIEFSINADNIQDMPIHHSSIINKDQIQEILDYNYNDVKYTLDLFNIVKGNTELKLYKGIDKLELRRDLIKEFKGNKNWYNYNDVKLGDEINKRIYLNLIRVDLKDFKKKMTIRSTLNVKDCIEPYVEFKLDEFKDFYDSFTKIIFNPTNLPENEFRITYKYLNISFGFHSIDSKRNIQLSENEHIIDADCALNWRTINLVN